MLIIFMLLYMYQAEAGWTRHQEAEVHSQKVQVGSYCFLEDFSLMQ